MAVMFCGWDGNRKSGVALAMRYRLSGIPTYELNGLENEDEHPPSSTGVLRHLYITCIFVRIVDLSQFVYCICSLGLTRFY